MGTFGRIGLLRAGLAIAILPAAVPVKGELKSVSIGVLGATCATWAYKLDSELRRLDGVQEVNVTLKPGLATIKIEPGRRVDPAKLVNVVASTGLQVKPGSMRLRVAGTVVRSGNEAILRLSRMKQPAALLLRQGRGSGNQSLTRSASPRQESPSAAIELEGAWNDRAGAPETITPSKRREANRNSGVHESREAIVGELIVRRIYERRPTRDAR